MRIIGGKDYYDHGLAYGVDDQITFVRTGRKIRDSEFPVKMTGGAPEIDILSDDRPRWRRDRGNSRGKGQAWEYRGMTLEAGSVHVVFCGRYYSGVRVYYTDKEIAPYDKKDWQRNTFWDEESFNRFLKKYGAEISTPEKNKKRIYLTDSDRYKPCDCRDLTDEEKSAIITMGITVAVSTNEDLENIGDGTGRDYRFWQVDSDCLKTVDFIKVLDPVRAFQEISMWVGGVLPKPGNPMVQIVDEKIRQHKAGMDKTSFRRAKETAR